MGSTSVPYISKASASVTDMTVLLLGESRVLYDTKSSGDAL
jgi:hypothetical protein